MRRFTVGWFGAAAATLALGFQGPQNPRLQPVARFQDPALVEVSGLVASRTQPGVFWTHNDSGNPPLLFAVKSDGTLLKTYKLEVPNLDWEDVATDDAGHLYLGDIGNNDSRLPVRSVYQIDEPNLTKPTQNAIRPSLAVHYRFTKGQAFDAEGLFVDSGRAFLVTKRFDGREAEVFSLPLRPGSTLLRPVTPERVQTLEACVEPATGASLSVDAQRLAVVTLKMVRIYRASPQTKAGWKLEATVAHEAPGVEAVAWDGNDLILASEDRSIYRVSQAVWQASANQGGRAK